MSIEQGIAEIVCPKCKYVGKGSIGYKCPSEPSICTIISSLKALIASEQAEYEIIFEFTEKIAKVFDASRDSHVFFYMQQAFGDGDWNEGQDIINQVLQATQALKGEGK